jgi:hypothetical protein
VGTAAEFGLEPNSYLVNSANPERQEVDDQDPANSLIQVLSKGYTP